MYQTSQQHTNNKLSTSSMGADSGASRSKTVVVKCSVELVGRVDEARLSAGFEAAVAGEMGGLRGTDKMVVELELPTGRGRPASKQLEWILSAVYVHVERHKAARDELLIQVEVVILGFSQHDRAQSPFFAGPDDDHDMHRELFPTLALGGTFDHLHSGHKILLTMASWLATRRLVVGITDDELLKNKQHADWLEPLSERQKAVHMFLERVGPRDLVVETPVLQDVYGPTAWDPDIDALLVSKETLPGAQAIDAIRAQNSLTPLARYVIDVISHNLSSLPDDQDLKDLKISSTHIRAWLNSRSPSPQVPPTT
ncbi:hypothetical protein PCANC_16776 [Puccinia coronata f. sp. avenae]|uniref:Cytidyltransferase-like domain-containing protein n=1 Tax=Puccinia coronata f. sp. avenae TaxID=200324 RepID=A0A2N5V6E2_9BASI|nr:hypothetical protein PCANC_16776 [Puccinia coronata f. sp. avenae]PLW45563.1 hypothetical protein PCASD_06282 [Puccinia coronata f. sp. avenae]